MSLLVCFVFYSIVCAYCFDRFVLTGDEATQRMSLRRSVLFGELTVLREWLDQ